MNKVFRKIWSKVKSAWVIVAEIVSSNGGPSAVTVQQAEPKSGRWIISTALQATLVASLLTLFAPFAEALPTNPQVIHGTANIQTNGNMMNITNSPNAIINWGSFSIANNETARFIQQSSTSSVLNRVIGGDPSRIFGALQSNGRVFLINQNGILIGAGARIDVAGLAASTLNLSNQDFLAGRLQFADANMAGKIENQGVITTPEGGQVYLIAPDVTNKGTITAPNGDVLLAAGKDVLLIEKTTPEIAYVISAPEDQALNLGTIAAEVGRVGMYGSMVRNSGNISADSATSEGGKIYLRATKKLELAETSSITADGAKGGEILAITAENGTVTGDLIARGNISAKGDGSPNSGGFVETSAANLDLHGVDINTNGGTWLIDPYDIVIAEPNSGGNITGTAVGDALANNHVRIYTSNSGAGCTAGADACGGFTPPAGSSGNGDITVNQGITWSSSKTLILEAYNDININAGIEGGRGSTLVLEAGKDNTNDEGKIQQNYFGIKVGTLNATANTGIFLYTDHNEVQTFSAINRKNSNISLKNVWNSGSSAMFTLNDVENKADSGSIRITSTNSGVFLAGNSTVRSNGNINIIGTHVNGGDGVTLSEGSEIMVTDSTSSATISIIGEGANGKVGIAGSVSNKASNYADVIIISDENKVTQTGSGVITAGKLTANAATGIELVAVNEVKQFTANSTGAGANIELRNSGSLDVNNVTANNGTITIQNISTGGDINITGAVNAGTGSDSAVILSITNGSISQEETGIITANQLTATAATGINLAAANNEVQQFSATNNGSSGDIALNNVWQPSDYKKFALNNVTNSASGGEIEITSTNAGIKVNDGQTINSNGGKITLNGTNANQSYGVWLGIGASLNSGGGAINISGKATDTGAAGRRGVHLDKNSSITSADGTITISGTGAAGDSSAAGYGGNGVSAIGSSIAAGTGDVTITGTGGKGADGDTASIPHGGIGVSIESTSGAAMTITGANITITGNGGAGGKYTGSGSNRSGVGGTGVSIQKYAVGGDIVLTADKKLAITGTGGNGGDSSGTIKAGFSSNGINIAGAALQAGANDGVHLTGTGGKGGAGATGEYSRAGSTGVTLYANYAQAVPLTIVGNRGADASNYAYQAGDDINYAVELSGGIIQTMDKDLKVTGNGAVAGSDYNIYIYGDLYDASSIGVDNSGSTAAQTGTISFTGNLLNLGHLGVAAGSSINVDGNYSQKNSSGTTGNLYMAVNDVNTYSKLAVAGDAQLAGDLHVAIDNTYTPKAGNTFTILTANAISNDFDAVHIPAGYAANQLSFAVAADKKSGVINDNTTAPEPPNPDPPQPPEPEPPQPPPEPPQPEPQPDQGELTSEEKQELKGETDQLQNQLAKDTQGMTTDPTVPAGLQLVGLIPPDEGEEDDEEGSGGQQGIGGEQQQPADPQGEKPPKNYCN